MSKPLKRFLFVVSAVFCLGTTAQAQDLAVKSNLIYLTSATLNSAVEIGLFPKSTLDVSVGFNPFVFSKNRKMRHWLVQPEWRWWFNDRFAGSFVGIHGSAAWYNVSDVNLPIGRFKALKDTRYAGHLVGVGLTVGHQWALSRNCRIEALLGCGYADIDYERFDSKKCSPKLSEGRYDYWGVTKVGLSIVYIIK